ncbi:aldehyde dehydrogenase family protein [Nocardioides sp. IC4_145]|uniref:aldehyde dehydrogenase family protein n=1 Tax=Nocardioides sp. IC4_145 TaxID=2714037 RepID=UPI0014081AB9|nr:aldehyde dehydrogenase family protein [Nocardioides sp. IC4_145]NHC24330.1 aldehyde dehydrogenase family protein [Nocardioides sp. IC4_145]
MTSDQIDLALPVVQAFVARAQSSFVHGERVAHDDNTWFDSLDPATGQPLTQVNEAGAGVVDHAARSAQSAFDSVWGSMLPAERERLLHRLADLLEANATELAQFDALESGKPVASVEAIDVALAVEQFRYYAGWPTKLQGATIPVASPDSHVYTRREPLGVVAAITPWNFPLCQAAIKLAPALAAGNTVVLKPSELTSMSSLRLAELAMEAGFPPGVLNVVTGTGPVTGQALITHPLIHKISFTGSEAVGRHLAAEAGRALKHVSLELGGKNPHVVFADADVDKAAAYAATTAFFYTGQVCFAGSRLMVERSALDQVMATLEEHARGLVMGGGLSETATMGPLSSELQREKVERYLQNAQDSKAQIAFGGKRPGGDLAAGYFLEPTAVLEPADDDAVVAEEIFGPVVVVQPFDDVEELVSRANAGNFGLTAGVWTRDGAKAHSVAARLKAGTVWVNTYGDFNAAAPWGGFRASGLGRDCGPEGLDKYLQTKTVWMALS